MKLKQQKEIRTPTAARKRGWLLMIAVASLAISGPIVMTGDAAAADKIATVGDPVTPAITLFVDISIASRKKRAAARMTELHAEMAQKGYDVIDVEPYTENGDLQGFYVTYVAAK